MKWRTFALGLAAASMTFAGTALADWKPERNITIIVPWSAGGSTDQVTRVVAPILEKALGVKIAVVNQPGASGSIGTKAALDAPRDGHTWTANAIANNATYSVTDLIKDTTIDDYRIYLHVANTPVVGVNADAPYKDFGEMLKDMQSGGNLAIATAGVNSSGGMAIAALNEAAGGELSYRMVAYDGGNPAVIATAGGEAVATTQLAVEQSEMLRAGRIRALAVLADKPLNIEGVDPIPPITNWLPDMPIAPDYFGVFIPVGAPKEVYETMDKVWAEHVMDAPALKKYASDRGATFDPSYGDEARKRAMPVVIAEACARVTRNEAILHPKEIGIDCDKMAEMK